MSETPPTPDQGPETVKIGDDAENVNIPTPDQYAPQVIESDQQRLPNATPDTPVLGASAYAAAQKRLMGRTNLTPEQVVGITGLPLDMSTAILDRMRSEGLAGSKINRDGSYKLARQHKPPKPDFQPRSRGRDALGVFGRQAREVGKSALYWTGLTDSMSPDRTKTSKPEDGAQDAPLIITQSPLNSPKYGDPKYAGQRPMNNIPKPESYEDLIKNQSKILEQQDEEAAKKQVDQKAREDEDAQIQRDLLEVQQMRLQAEKDSARRAQASAREQAATAQNLADAINNSTQEQAATREATERLREETLKQQRLTEQIIRMVRERAAREETERQRAAEEARRQADANRAPNTHQPQGAAQQPAQNQRPKVDLKVIEANPNDKIYDAEIVED